mgnify:CR=1 FL=1
MTWEEMIKMEPELLDLYNMARAYKRTHNFCANQVWYGPGGLKHKMIHLVGWGAYGVLRTCEAYDIAYHKIYDALPRCNHGDPYC